MKKLMKGAFLLTICALFLSACGGVKSTPYDGKWIAVSAEAMGMQMNGEEAFDGEFSFEINGTGKLKLIIDNEEYSTSWAEKDGKVVIDAEGEEMVGTPGDNIITFENVLGQGMKVIFAKEGTDAMNPENYLSEEVKAMIGSWKTESVKDVLGQELSEVEGFKNINEALLMDFKGDGTVDVTFLGESLGTLPWSFAIGMGTIDTDKYTILFEELADGKVKLSISNAEMYYDFICVKQ
ncbi:MAG: hypothetical protein Q3993_02810 [Filifactor alocis]|nr:hypothetical protein [Filifactor alocis]